MEPSTAIVVGINGIKKAFDYATKIGNAQLQMDLTAALQEQVALIDENQALKQRVAELETQLSFQGKLSILDGVYWVEAKDESETRYPICSACYGSERSVIPLSLHNTAKRNGTCPACKALFRLVLPGNPVPEKQLQTAGSSW